MKKNGQAGEDVEVGPETGRGAEAGNVNGAAEAAAENVAVVIALVNEEVVRKEKLHMQKWTSQMCKSKRCVHFLPDQLSLSSRLTSSLQLGC